MAILRPPTPKSRTLWQLCVLLPPAPQSQAEHHHYNFRLLNSQTVLLFCVLWPQVRRQCGILASPAPSAQPVQQRRFLGCRWSQTVAVRESDHAKAVCPVTRPRREPSQQESGGSVGAFPRRGGAAAEALCSLSSAGYPATPKQPRPGTDPAPAQHPPTPQTHPTPSLRHMKGTLPKMKCV